MKTSKLIMVVGLPGTGKSTFSRALAANLDAAHLNSDVIRTEMGLRGRYAAEDKAKVYAELQDQTRTLLNSGTTVIVDATLYLQELRQPYTDLANEEDCAVLWIELQTGEATIKKRVAKQRRYSEADMDVYRKIKVLYEPLAEHHLCLETDTAPLEILVEAAKQFIEHEPTAN